MPVMDEPRPASGPAKAGLTVPWTWLSAGLATVAVGALGTLGVVVGINDVDTLSTIALALAVLAFAAQLIVSLAQGMAAAQQVAQVERVNADTQAALAALRATSDALLATQREHFGELLRAALSKAVPEAVEETLAAEGSSPGDGLNEDLRREQLEGAIVSRVFELLKELPDSRQSSGESRYNRSLARKPRPEFHTLNTFPDETEGRKFAKILKTLSPWESQGLARIASEVRHRAESGMVLETRIKKLPDGDRGPALTGLCAKGLIDFRDRADRPQSDHEYMTLTDLGLGVARLMIAPGRHPSWLVDEMRS